MISLRTRVIFLSLLTPFLWLICAGFTIGLTWAPCYSSMCVEEFFPKQTRIHIAIFYGLILVIGVLLFARALSTSFQRLSERHLCDIPVPFAEKRLSVGGAILCILIPGAIFGSTGLWYPAENTFWLAKGVAVGWTEYMSRVIWTGVTGHWCDILIGLVILPIGRNSLLAKVFYLQTSTLLLAHKILAYGLLVGGLIHGLLYYSFLGAYVNAADNDSIREAFVPDNPTIPEEELPSTGGFAAACLPTGAIAGIVLIPVIAITALPALRRSSFNTFYFIHVSFAVITIVLVCLHASTNFYFVLPGLLLWVVDWIYRIRYALGTKAEVQVENAGNGWYRVKLARDDAGTAIDPKGEADEAATIAPVTRDALQTYYLNIPEISKIQAHPFTVACEATSWDGPVILFRRGPSRKKVKATDKEWTWKLATIADNSSSEKSVSLQARIEGPYIPQVAALQSADHVLAVVGGTGITGALSVVNWWSEQHAGEPVSAKSCRLVWSVRERSIAELQEVTDLQERLRDMPNVDLRIRVSSESGRLNCRGELDRFTSPDLAKKGNVWVYTSGPTGLMADMETACVKTRKTMRKAGVSNNFTSLEWYSARFTT